MNRKSRKIIGSLIALSPIIALYSFIFYTLGTEVFAKTLGAVAAIVAVVFLGVWIAVNAGDE